MILFVWISLAVLTIWYGIVFTRDFVKNRKNLEPVSWLKAGLIGFVVNFFDVLGIGAFAPQTALLKFTKQTEDRILPGTLNVANTLPVLVQAIIFITVIKVDPVTLVFMLIAAAAGAILGAGVVSKLSEKKIRLTMGVALFITAAFMIAGKMEWIRGGGTDIGLSYGKLAIAVVVNFLLGALMTAGIGLYAPCMALVYALGLSPQVAFPIMMGSCAFLMPVASLRFIKAGAYDPGASLAFALGGIPAVLIAAFIVKSLPLTAIRYLVVVVVLYASVSLLLEARKNGKTAS